MTLKVFEFNPGDYVYKLGEPKKKYKIHEIFVSYPKMITFLYVEDMDTHELEFVVSDWLAKEPWKWRDSDESTKLRSVDELKEKNILSAEKLYGRKVSEIIASWDVPSKMQIDLLKVVLPEAIRRKSGVDYEKVETFLKRASYRVGADDTYWVFDDDGRRISFRMDECGNIDNINFYIGNYKVSSNKFFSGIRTVGSMVKIVSIGDKYILTMGNKKYVLSYEDLESFCEDYGLNIGSVKSSISKCGKWSI